MNSIIDNPRRNNIITLMIKATNMLISQASIDLNHPTSYIFFIIYQKLINPKICPKAGMNPNKNNTMSPRSTVPDAFNRLRFLNPSNPVARCNKIVPIINVTINWIDDRSNILPISTPK